MLLLTNNVNCSSRNSFADRISCFAHISSRIFRISIQDIQSNETKIVCSFETMAIRNRASIAVPFNFHCWIIDRCQSGFQMSTGTFRQVFNALQRTTELRFLSYDNILMCSSLVTGIVLQMLDLLQSTFVLGITNNGRLG